MKRYDLPTEIIEATVRHYDDAGNGIALHRHAPTRGSMGKSLKLIIPNTVPGDVVRVTVENATGRNSARLDRFELLEASPDRDLNHPIKESIAGGAPLQYATYESQLKFKEEQVRKYLARGDFDADLVKPIIGLDEPDHYRNKMEFTFGPNGEMGMHEQGNFKHIIDLEESILAPHVMMEIKEIVAEWQAAFGLRGYDKETTEGFLRQLVIRESAATGELMVIIFATEGVDQVGEAVLADLVARLSNGFEDLVSLLWVKSTSVADQVASDEMRVLYGRDYINESLNGFHYKLYMNTFFQANSKQAEIMVQTALDLAGADADMRVLELFCGIGTFSLPFAKQVKELVGIEYVEQSIVSAQENAVSAGLSNTRFFASDARKGLEKLKKTWPTPDLLVINPPRSGAGGKLMRSIGRYGSERIVYISCNPKTLADDLKWLRDFDYELKSVQPIDQFAHTVHVESVVFLEKKPAKELDVKTFEGFAEMYPEKIEGTDAWYFSQWTPCTEAYEVPDYDGEYPGTRLIFFEYPSGEVFEPVKQEANVFLEQPVYDRENDTFGVLRYDFNLKKIQVLAIKSKNSNVEVLLELDFPTTHDLVNVRLITSPLTMLQHNDETNISEFIWPEKKFIQLEENEAIHFQHEGKLYTSKWREELDYSEEMIVRNVYGVVIERGPGSLKRMPDGSVWKLTGKTEEIEKEM